MENTHFAACGDPEIDQVRLEAGTSPTDATNLGRRLMMLTSWLTLLQKQGIRLDAYVQVYDELQACSHAGNAAGLFAAVDRAYGLLADIMQRPDPQPPIVASRQPQPAAVAQTEDSWPLYGANVHHTASTAAPGPTSGELAWRFPVGLAWYARPVVEDGRVYVASPGLRDMLYCLDLATGRRLWHTPRPWANASQRLRLGRGQVTAQSYATPSVACTPLVLSEAIVLSELGAQAMDNGARCLTWIAKTSGELLCRVAVGDGADYRLGYAALGGDDQFIVYPTSKQHIGAIPPHFVGQNRIACRRATDGRLEWDFHIGPTFCEPTLADGQVFTGTADGMVYCLNTTGASVEQGFGMSDRRRVGWAFKAEGSVNVAPVVVAARVYFGANDGWVYALERASGRLAWKSELPAKEPRSFKFASRPVVAGDRLYIGTAGRQLCCLDAATGRLLWVLDLPEWVRAAPVVVSGRVYVVCMDGSLFCIQAENGQVVEWRVQIGTHPVYADLVCAGGRLLIASSDLNLWCVACEDGSVVWRQHLLPEVARDGRLIRSDDLGSGGYYQSKPTAAEGKVFIGTPSRFVHALDAASGRELWRFELGAAVSGAPAYAQGKLLVGQQGGEEHFYCLDALTGHPLWKQATGWVWSSATIDEGRVYLPGVDGYVSCLDLNHGHVLWRYRTGMACHPEAPILDGRIFFGSWDHYVYAFDKATGRHLWQFHTGGTPDSGAPLAVDGKLYVPMGGKRLCCLDPADATVYWEYEVEHGCMNASPAFWNERLYVSVNVRPGAIPATARIRCLDAKSGRMLWEHPGGGITGPAVADGKVYFGSTADNLFRCVDAIGNGDGTTDCLWRYPMGDRVYESVPCLYARKALILCDDGWLYAFD